MSVSSPPISADQFCLVMTSVGNEQEAKQIAQSLLNDRLAACIQIFPMQSHYIWKEELQEDQEYLLLIKARQSDWQKIEAAIRKIHSYEIAEILKLDLAAGHAPYLAWMQQATQRKPL